MIVNSPNNAINLCKLLLQPPPIHLVALVIEAGVYGGAVALGWRTMGGVAAVGCVVRVFLWVYFVVSAGGGGGYK